MMFRNVCGVALAMTLGAFGCSQNPPAQQPTTTGAQYGENGTNTSQGVGAQGSLNGGASAGQNGVGADVNGNAGVNAGHEGADVNGGAGVSAGQGGIQGGMHAGAGIGDQGNTGMQGGSMQQGGQMQGQNSFQNDGEIAAYLQAVNQGEEQQARLAVQKAKDPQVKAYAQYLLNHHKMLQQNEQRMLSSQNVTPQAGQATNQLQTQAQQLFSSLQGKTGADFDKAYVDAQVQEHQMVLNALDNDMIPAARNTQFKQELQTVRGDLQNHLQRAQSLQQRLQGNTNNP